MGEWNPTRQDRPATRWTPPLNAYESDLPGVSAYLHYWLDLRHARNEAAADTEPAAEMRQALNRLVRQGFGP